MMTERLTLLSFLTVGALAAVVNFTSFSLLWKFWNLHYESAVSIAFILSVIFHFTANRHVTFKGSSTHFFYQLPKYISMVLVNYLMTLVIMYCVVGVMHLSPYLGNVVAIGMTVCIGYCISRYWVFI